MKYLKLVHAQTWKIPHYTLYGTKFFDKGVFHGIFQVGFALSATPVCLVRYIFWKKMISHEIFQVGPCPNLKDSSFYERFSIHMYKAWSIRYLQHFCAICDSLMLCKVHLFAKRWFSMKYFKMVHAPTWKIPHYMIGFLFIYTRHEAFSIHIYKAWSVRYLQLFSAIWDSLMLCMIHFLEKHDFGLKDKVREPAKSAL